MTKYDPISRKCMEKEEIIYALMDLKEIVDYLAVANEMLIEAYTRMEDRQEIISTDKISKELLKEIGYHQNKICIIRGLMIDRERNLEKLIIRGD